MAVSKIEIGLMTAAAQADHIVRPSLSESEDDIVSHVFQVRFDGAREGPHSPGGADHRRTKLRELHFRMGRALVAATNDGHLVTVFAQVVRHLVEIAFGAAGSGLAQMNQRDVHQWSLRATTISPRLNKSTGDKASRRSSVSIAAPGTLCARLRRWRRPLQSA